MKSRMEYHARREGALPIVDRLENELENNVGWLKSKEHRENSNNFRRKLLKD